MTVQEQAARLVRPTLRPLSKQEIDRRIEGVWAELLASRALLADPKEDELRPVWVSTPEFVRRMQAFLVRN